MAFEHTETAWSEFLKQVQAGRPPNVKVTGQPMSDDLVGTVAIGEARHLAPPIGWNVAAFQTPIGSVAGEYSRLEMICTRPTQVLMVEGSADCNIFVIDVPVLGAHLPPVTVFSGTAENLIGWGWSALPVPITGEFMLDTPAGVLWLNTYPVMPIYVERGRIFVIRRPTANSAINAGLVWREIPQTR